MAEHEVSNVPASEGRGAAAADESRALGEGAAHGRGVIEPASNAANERSESEAHAPGPRPVLFDDAAHDYDAVLVVSFGGPEGPDDVMPFLDNVFRGLPVTEETRQRIAARYLAHGGVSPINAEVRKFIEALRRELESRGPALKVYWGNRNWHPLLADTLAEMRRDGVRRACAYVTSTFSSYSGCRKYREDLYVASRGLESPPVIDKLRIGYNHPGFIAAMTERVRDALAAVGPGRRGTVPILFTAHSLPESMARHSRYETQLREACRLVAEGLGHTRWRLVYQSNNARYGGEPWLLPDISDALAEQKTAGDETVVVAPIGFVCDHMEVIVDLDEVAAATAERLGLEMIRAATVGAHPAYVGMVRDLIVERMTARPARAALGDLGPNHDFCPPDCCLNGRPGAPRPSLGGTDSAAR